MMDIRHGRRVGVLAALVAFAALFAIAAPATAADVELPRIRNKVRGDLAPGQVDRIRLSGPDSSRVKLTLKVTSGDLQLGLRVLYSDVRGATPGTHLREIDQGTHLKISGNGRKLRLRNYAGQGYFVLEISGTGTGTYSGKVDLSVPRQSRLEPTLAYRVWGNGVIYSSGHAVPPGGAIVRVRYRLLAPFDGDPEPAPHYVDSFGDIDGGDGDVTMLTRDSGYDFIPATAARLRVLIVSIFVQDGVDGGFGARARSKTKHRIHDKKRRLLDLTDS